MVGTGALIFSRHSIMQSGRSSKEIALELVTSLFRQRRPLKLGFHTFGKDWDFEALAESQNGSDERF